MATVPNYYYNSPWIEAAGRNLADALRPEDPDKLRLREQNKWEFQYKQNKADQETTDRANNERSRAAIGKMYALQKSPKIGADGKIDSAATEKEAFSLADEAMTYGPKDVRAEVDDALFNLSPTFARKRILQRQAEDFRTNQLTRSLAGAMDQLNRRGEIQGGLQDDDQDFELRKMREQYDLRLKEWQVRAALAAKKSGKDLITVTPALADKVMMEILRREKATGNKLTPEDRFAFAAQATDDLQTSRNPIASVQNLWNTRFPQARYVEAPTQELPGTGMFDNWYGGTDTYLKPEEAPAAPPADPTTTQVAEPPRDFGTAATTPPPAAGNPFLARGQAEAEMEQASRDASRAQVDAIPLPGAARPPAAAKSATAKGGKVPKEGTRARSKKGAPIIVRGGKWVFDESQKK